MKILLGEFNAKVDKEHNFKQKIGHERLRKWAMTMELE
jgi:hypothetical protein